MRILRGQSNLEVSSKGFAIFVVGLVLSTFVGGAVKTLLSSDQVHNRIVTELKAHFPKQEFQIGQTEVLLSRGIWPALGLRVHNLNFKQDVCGKLSFVLTIPVAVLPLDIFSLHGNHVRLNDIEIDGGELHLDYHACPPRMATETAGGPTTGGAPKSLSAPRFDWMAIGQHLNGIELKNFAVTYEKNPTWKLMFNSAYMSFSSELNANAQVEVQKSLPFGALTHLVTLNLHGDGSVLQWTLRGEFKEGRVSFTGSVDTAQETASAKVNIRQVPLKDFMSEMFEMNLVEHDLKLKATWLSCSLGWEGHLPTYSESPVHFHDCRVEGGYGRAELAQGALWLNGGEDFRPPAHLQIEQLELQPLVEALNRQVLPAVFSRLGVWGGQLDFSNRNAWRLDGNLENSEIVFVNQSMHGKQLIDRVHTTIESSDGRIHGQINELHPHEGEFAGHVDFDLSGDWRNGVMRAQVDKLALSPAIQKLLVGGTVRSVNLQGEAHLQEGELVRWQGQFGLTDLRGEGWRADGVQVRSNYLNGIFHIEGAVKAAMVDNSWRFFPELRHAWSDLPDQVAWHDLAAKVDIQKTGGTVQSMTATEVQGHRVWKSKGTWLRDGDYTGILNVALQGKKAQSYTVHGEKGEITIEDNVGGQPTR